MIYIACENANFVWKPNDVREFDRLWREENIRDIHVLAKRLRRPASDVAFLIWDRTQSGFKSIPLSRSEAADKLYAKRTKANAKQSSTPLKAKKRGKKRERKSQV